MTTPTLDPILAAHIAAREQAIKAAFPQIDTTHYLDVVLLDRSQRYAAHLEQMTVTPDMVQWAIAMSRQYGPYVKVWHYVADWLTALLIIRYGEEPDAAQSTDPNFTGWPLAFTDEDRVRANELLGGVKWPEKVLTLLPRDPNAPET